MPASPGRPQPPSPDSCSHEPGEFPPEMLLLLRASGNIFNLVLFFPEEHPAGSRWRRERADQCYGGWPGLPSASRTPVVGPRGRLPEGSSWGRSPARPGGSLGSGRLLVRLVTAPTPVRVHGARSLTSLHLRSKPGSNASRALGRPPGTHENVGKGKGTDRHKRPATRWNGRDIMSAQRGRRLLDSAWRPLPCPMSVSDT